MQGRRWVAVQVREVFGVRHVAVLLDDRKPGAQLAGQPEQVRESRGLQSHTGRHGQTLIPASNTNTNTNTNTIIPASNTNTNTNTLIPASNTNTLIPASNTNTIIPASNTNNNTTNTNTIISARNTNTNTITFISTSNTNTNTATAGKREEERREQY